MVKDKKQFEEYSQPSFYRFSDDTIMFSKMSARLINALSAQYSRILDFGAGCGVIGIEIKQLLSESCQVDFLESQREFDHCLAANLKRFQINDSRIFGGFEEIADKYDIIVSNPPFFDLNSSRSSPCPLKNMCRLISKENADLWLKRLYSICEPGGLVFLQLPSLEKTRFWDKRLDIFCRKQRIDVEIMGKAKASEFIYFKKKIL